MRVLQSVKNLLIKKIKAFVLDTNLVSKGSVIGGNTLLRRVVLSGNIEVGPNCKIVEAEIRGAVSIGHHTTIWGPNTILTASINGIKVGNYCSIARNVTIQEYNHNHKRFTSYYLNKNILKNTRPDITSKGEIIIGHDVWIGDGAKILSGVRIDTGAVVGSNSVVTKDVPPYAIVGGVPAKVVGYRFNETIIQKLLETKWWELKQEELAIQIPYLDSICSGDKS